MISLKIAPHVESVLMNLAEESGQWSRQLLQNIVDILTSMVEGMLNTYEGDAQEMFRDKYFEVVSNLLIDFQCH